MAQLMYTTRDVANVDAAAHSHMLHWPRNVITQHQKVVVHSTSLAVVERMRVSFINPRGLGCLRATVIMDVSDVDVVTHFVKSTKTCVTCVQGSNMLCL